MAIANYRKFKKAKFQETIVGIIFLGVFASAIWFFISPENNKDIKNNNIDNKKIKDNILNNSEIIGGNKIEGDLISGDKIINGEKHTELNIKEYIFVNKYCAITALVDYNDKVLAYSITTIDKNFNPELYLVEHKMISTSTVNSFEFRTDILEFKLGITTFKEISKILYGPTNTYGMMGSNYIYYSEEYYRARPGNYQSYIFSFNEVGIGYDKFADTPPYFLNEEFYNEKKEEVDYFRSTVPPNTYTITSPFFYLGEEIRDYEFGPSKIQMLLLDQEYKIIEKETLLKNIKTLYPESNINYFIKLFGDPVFVNNIEK